MKFNTYICNVKSNTPIVVKGVLYNPHSKVCEGSCNRLETLFTRFTSVI